MKPAVTPKKHLGQHFLNNPALALQIVESLTGHGNPRRVLEIGPGMGVLTQFLLQHTEYETWVAEVDVESVAYLKAHFPTLENRILEGDVLRMPLDEHFPEPFAIIGNFPYNISSQILFRVLDYRHRVTEVVGMFQDEVARRICSGPGGRDYGILSVLLQAYYQAEYLFTVDKSEFIPPPQVQSGVLRLKRNAVETLPVPHEKFLLVVKTAFNQRRKTLRNALKGLSQDKPIPYSDLRAERLGVAEFVELTQILFPGA